MNQTAHSGASMSVPSVFNAARGKALNDSDLDAYITAPLTANDRVIAHRLMAFMPPNERGDFLYLTADGRVISNNAALLQYAKLTHASPKVQDVSRRPTMFASARRHALDYSSPCSPTNPYAGTGPYVRQVSKCGFGGGWAFLKVPCATTSLRNGDNGYAYFEITAPGNANHIEGGVFTPDGTTFDPYLRSNAISTNNGYETLTNGSARYFCGEQLGLFHGITWTVPNYSFTEIGDASQYNPYTVWVDRQQVTLSDTAWLFGPMPSSITSARPGIDSAGYNSPCINCSMSQVSAIAQPNARGSWDQDFSEFGVDSNGNNAIQWLQVGFGNWASDCSPGTTLCYFYVAADPFVYYGGSQAYPDDYVSGSDFNLTGYGPYETVDGIDALGGGSQMRAADIAINEPLPPVPCTLDSMGYCSIQTSATMTHCYVEVWNSKIQDYVYKPVTYAQTQVFATYQAGPKQVALDTETTTRDNGQDGNCDLISVTWSPAEPSVLFSDPNLP